MDNVGDLLIKMFMLCKEHNVDITIGIADRNTFGPSSFEIQLERDKHRISRVVDTTRAYREPSEIVDYVFNNALFDLNYHTNKENNYAV